MITHRGLRDHHRSCTRDCMIVLIQDARSAGSRILFRTECEDCLRPAERVLPGVRSKEERAQPATVFKTCAERRSQDARSAGESRTRDCVIPTCAERRIGKIRGAEETRA